MQATRRPGGLRIFNSCCLFRAGVPAALDFGVTSGLRTDALVASVSDGSSAAVAYESFKCSHLTTLIPIVVEASGGWAPRRALLGLNLPSLRLRLPASPENTTMMALQTLTVLLHWGSARAILRRRPALLQVPLTSDAQGASLVGLRSLDCFCGCGSFASFVRLGPACLSS